MLEPPRVKTQPFYVFLVVTCFHGGNMLPFRQHVSISATCYHFGNMFPFRQHVSISATCYHFGNMLPFPHTFIYIMTWKEFLIANTYTLFVFAWYYYYSMVLRNWFVNCFTLYLEFLLLYLLPHNAQHQHKSSQQVQLNKTLMNPIEHEMVIATPCYFGCKCKQLFLCLSKCQGSIFLPIHYRLSCVNMLGLFLTTTSLPPPVWTHISLLFVQTCVQFQLIVVLIGSVAYCSSHRISIRHDLLFPIKLVAHVPLFVQYL